MPSKHWWSSVKGWWETRRPPYGDELPTGTKVKDRWKTFGKFVAVILGTLLLLWLLPELVGGAAYSYYYTHYFRTLTTEGSMNPWVAGAISILFAASVALGASMIVSIKRRLRGFGAAVLLGTSVAFHLLMYACTRSAAPAEEAPRFVRETGDPNWYSNENGVWEFFRGPGVNPRTGERLKPMTPQAAQEFYADKQRKEELDRQKTAEREKQAKVEAAEREMQAKAEKERQFVYDNSNPEVLSSSTSSADRIILALKSDQSDSQGDVLQGLLAELLARKNKTPLSGVFKSAFYTGGLFDELWSGDHSVLERLRLFDGAPACLLMCKANVSGASKTEFDGLVSVQGTVSIILVTKDGRSGPSVFKASGAGGDRPTAIANCAKRLVESIDLDVFFRK